MFRKCLCRFMLNIIQVINYNELIALSFYISGITFTPRETGPHIVNVYRNGQHIPNSPFTITVGESELGDASKVKVYGKGLEEGMANEVNEFVVDTSQAG